VLIAAYTPAMSFEAGSEQLLTTARQNGAASGNETPVSREPYDPTTYGAAIAEAYDEMYESAFDTEGAVAFLVDLSRGGPVLEFGIGTGRLALPLVARGLAVGGVESSPEMVEQLRRKPGGDSIDVALGDFAEVQVDRPDGRGFSVVLLAINTIFALPDQDAQVEVFVNAARHLRPDGHFVVEAWVPDLSRFHRGQGVWSREHGADHVSIEVARLDAAEQRMETTQVRFGPDGVRLYPANHRYAWPCELDLMARIAGLERTERWENWRRTPFVSSSWTHVSVYGKRSSGQ
jgi:SAM-dependent methyltransferase